MLTMLIMIEMSGLMELNEVSPKTQSLINIFLYFCFGLFSTDLNLPGPVEAKSCKLCGKAALFYSATDCKSRFPELI